MTDLRDPERDLLRFRLPEPTPELARRVIDAGAARLSAVERPSGLERMWASSSMRLAWVASVALILLAGAGIERRVDRRLDRALGTPATAALPVPAPESLDLDPSWGPHLAWAARTEPGARGIPTELKEAIQWDEERSR